MKNKLKKILASKIWFLFGSFIFATAGIRFSIRGDKTGAIIYLVCAIIFLIGFIGQSLFNKKKY